MFCNITVGLWEYWNAERGRRKRCAPGFWTRDQPLRRRRLRERLDPQDRRTDRVLSCHYLSVFQGQSGTHHGHLRRRVRGDAGRRSARLRNPPRTQSWPCARACAPISISAFGIPATTGSCFPPPPTPKRLIRPATDRRAWACKPLICLEKPSMPAWTPGPYGERCGDCGADRLDGDSRRHFPGHHSERDGIPRLSLARIPNT